jgi:Ca-activated chloride channel family protein
MLEPDTMRLCNKAVLSVLILVSTLSLEAQQPAKPATPAPQTQNPSLTVDRDPVRSPDVETPATPAGEPLEKKGESYVLHTEVEEVFLNATVLSGNNQLVQNLKK